MAANENDQHKVISLSSWRRQTATAHAREALDRVQGANAYDQARWFSQMMNGCAAPSDYTASSIA